MEGKKVQIQTHLHLYIYANNNKKYNKTLPGKTKLGLKSPVKQVLNGRNGRCPVESGNLIFINHINFLKSIIK